MATLPELLKTLVELSGSDLHLTTSTPPQIRVHGKLQTLDLPSSRAGRDERARLQRAHRRAEEALRRGAGAGLLVRHPRSRALPLQRVQPARGGCRGVSGHPRNDQELQRARAAAGPRDSCRSAARPGARDRTDRQRQIDHARRDDRQDQHRAPRTHPDDRGSDRVHPPAQGLPGQPARGAQRHPRVRAAPCAPRSAKTPTSSSSASCATSKRSSRRCASPRRGISRSPRCTRTRRRRRSTASSTSSRRISRDRSGPSSRSCSKASSARR